MGGNIEVIMVRFRKMREASGKNVPGRMKRNKEMMNTTGEKRMFSKTDSACLTDSRDESSDKSSTNNKV